MSEHPADPRGHRAQDSETLGQIPTEIAAGDRVLTAP